MLEEILQQIKAFYIAANTVSAIACAYACPAVLALWFGFKWFESRRHARSMQQLHEQPSVKTAQQQRAPDTVDYGFTARDFHPDLYYALEEKNTES